MRQLLQPAQANWANQTRDNTCALHASLVQDAVQDVALAILVLFLEDQGCDLNEETGQLGLRSQGSLPSQAIEKQDTGGAWNAQHCNRWVAIQVHMMSNVAVRPC